MFSLLQVVPVGSAAVSFAKELAEPIKTEFGVDVVAGQGLGEPKYAFNKDRSQFHSSAILRRLSAVQVNRKKVGIVGVAEVDLFLPDVPFIFGDADRESRVALFSLARLRPELNGGIQNNDLLRRRGRTEMMHAVGHLIGLSHCENIHCVMFSSETVDDTDRKGLNLCHDCRAELARMAKDRARVLL